jgi:hypothetical protein
LSAGRLAAGAAPLEVVHGLGRQLATAKSSLGSGAGVRLVGAPDSKQDEDQALAELAELDAAALVAAGLAPDEDGEDEAGLWPLTIG